MALTPPKLDDRTFEQLLDEARTRAQIVCPEWTDWSPGNPGVALVELFAYLTETMIYRLNRLPEKAYVEFLRLMGVQLQPPAAATVMLKFDRIELNSIDSTEPLSGSESKQIEIPEGTRVTTADARDDALQFVTVRHASIGPDQHSTLVPAMNFRQVVGESLGRSTGLPAQFFRLQQAPVMASTGDPEELVIGVETPLEQIGTARSRNCAGKVFRLWTLVDHFRQLSDDPYVYTADRNDGTILFASAFRTLTEAPKKDNDEELDQYRSKLRLSIRAETLAEVPPANAEIRAWYRCGGGAKGNLAVGTLTRLLKTDELSGPHNITTNNDQEQPLSEPSAIALEEMSVVTNPAAATGGRDAESLDNAMIRGPQELHSQDRAITARDFERMAGSFGSVSRAKASAQADLWKHALPGTVEVLLVPEIQALDRADSRVSLQQLRDRQTNDAADEVQKKLNACRPLGSSVEVHWADYCEVRVKANVRCFRGEDTSRIRSEIGQRLNNFISPLETSAMPNGWAFDQQLPAGRLYDEIFRVPGVKEIDRLRLIVDDTPDNPIQSLAVDYFQPNTWHVISGHEVYRSLDNGRTWQHLHVNADARPTEPLQLIRADPVRPGGIAVVARGDGENPSSSVFYSEDCGRSWNLAIRTGGFTVHDVAWIHRDDNPTLLLATSSGLFEVSLTQATDAGLCAMSGLPKETGFWTIATTTDSKGRTEKVAVAAKEDKGVYVSYEAGSSMTYLPIGQQGRDVRSLHFQKFNSKELLWAGTRVVGSRPGEGCSYWEGAGQDWTTVIRDWPGDAGSCLQLTSQGKQLFAATYGGGIVWLDAGASQDIAWRSAGRGCGLPLGTESRPFQPVTSLGAIKDGHMIAGGAEGMFHCTDNGLTWQGVCESERIDSVPLGRQMLFCAGEHELEMTMED